MQKKGQQQEQQQFKQARQPTPQQQEQLKFQQALQKLPLTQQLQQARKKLHAAAKQQLCAMLRNIKTKQQPATVRTQPHVGQIQTSVPNKEKQNVRTQSGGQTQKPVKDISKIFNQEINPVLFYPQYQKLSTTQKLIRILPPLGELYQNAQQQQIANDIMISVVKQGLLKNVVSKQQKTFSQLVRLVKKGVFLKTQQYIKQTTKLSDQYTKDNRNVSLELMVVVLLLGLDTSIPNEEFENILDLIYTLKENKDPRWDKLYDKTLTILLEKATKETNLDTAFLRDVFTNYKDLVYYKTNILLSGTFLFKNRQKIRDMLIELNLKNIADKLSDTKIKQSLNKVLNWML